MSEWAPLYQIQFGGSSPLNISSGGLKIRDGSSPDLSVWSRFLVLASCSGGAGFEECSMGDLDGRKGSRNWFLPSSEWAPRGQLLISARSPLFDQILLVIAYTRLVHRRQRF